jgi:heptosyltransferase III
MRRLVIRPGAIGDLIVSLPAIESLQDGYLEVWAREPNVPLVRFADRVRSIGSTGLDLLGLPAIECSPVLLASLRSFDSIVSWYGASRPEFRRAVVDLGLPFQFLEAMPIGGRHAVDFYLDQVMQVVKPCPKPASRQPDPLENESAGVCPTAPRIDCPPVRHDFAVVHPYASSPAKRWSLQKFREVASALGMPVQWCAGPGEELPQAVRVENLYDLACWLAGARVYIGNDSGISHLAAAVGIPAVVLFGPTDPAVWAPRGSRVLTPMESIEPAAVVSAARQVARPI